MSVLTLIRAKEEDSGNYSMRVDNGDKTHTVRLVLEVKGQRKPVSFCRARSFSPPPRAHASPHSVTVPAVIVDLMDIHHGSATGQSVVCVTRGRPTPLVEWFVCKNIKQ